PLPRLQFAATGQLVLQVLRQGEVHIVAAQQQMVADGHAVELYLPLFATADANQREIGRAATNVADENLLAWADELVPVVLMFVNPGIKGRLRLFDQHDS